MKEKERGENETEKKKEWKKKVPLRESNPRPLNLQPPHSYRLRDLLHYNNNNNTDIYRKSQWR